METDKIEARQFISKLSSSQVNPIVPNRKSPVRFSLRKRCLANEIAVVLASIPETQNPSRRNQRLLPALHPSYKYPLGDLYRPPPITKLTTES